VTTFNIYEGDALDWLATLPDASVDCCVTDFPYESLEKHRAKGTTTRLKHSKSSSNDWFNIFPNAKCPELFAQLYRVLKKNTHLYMFCDAETMFVIKPMGEAAGFKFWKPIVWEKVTMGMGYHYRCQYEFILFFEKGKRKLNDLGISDVLHCKRIRNGWPTEKPVGVCDTLVYQSTAPGELVIDPFCGSSSAGVAALKRGRSFAGCDIKPEACLLSRERLAPLVTL
jgi:site-specific DNA-methyltransferase (adenine-specific)